LVIEGRGEGLGVVWAALAHPFRRDVAVEGRRVRVPPRRRSWARCGWVVRVVTLVAALALALAVVTSPSLPRPRRRRLGWAVTWRSRRQQGGDQVGGVGVSGCTELPGVVFACDVASEGGWAQLRTIGETLGGFREGVDSPGLAFGLDVAREVGWGWAGDGG
jgi:hypothetical protein